MKPKLQIKYSPQRKKFPGRLLLLTCLATACWVTCVQPSYASDVNKVTQKVMETRVTGKVTDEKNAALTGVTVTVKGTTTGVVTDVNGDFSIVVPDAGTATLVFTYIGYLSHEVPLNGQKNINVTLLPDTRNLNEVVVVGYGTQKKATLTGSISVIKGGDIIKSPQPNVSDSFAGRISGVIANNTSGEPGYDGSNILIRGIATTGSNNVLVVVDGIPGQIGGLERLDPNDIESVSVLKDASAAVYGNRAANGVILITTKHGKTGKASVSYSFNEGFSSPTRLPKMADAATYAQIVNDISYYDSPSGGMNQVYSADQIQKFKDGSDPLNYPNTNWEKVTLKNFAMQNQQNLTVSGGNEDVKYFTSVGTLYQDGIYKNGATKYNQYNFRANVDATITSRLKVGLSLAGREEDRQYPETGAGSIFRTIYRSYPTSAAYYPNGLPTSGIDQVNPALAVTNIGGVSKNPAQYFNGILKASYDIPGIQGLSLDGFFAADKSGNFTKSFYTPYTVYTYNSAAQTYNPSIEGGGANGLASLYEAQLNQSLITSNIKLNFVRQFGGHNINAFVAYEQSQHTYDFFWAQRNDFPTPTTPELSEGGTAASDATNGGTSSDNNGNYNYNRRSVISRLAYNYEEKYLLEGQFRADGSSLFAPGHQWGYFPSVSAGYRISKEKWFSDKVKFFDDLKIRASYGVLGDDIISAYQYFDNYSFNNYVVLDNGSGAAVQSGIDLTKIANPNITWETAKKTDIGINAVFLKNFTLEAIYFNQKRSNILEYRNGSLPGTSGIVNPYGGTPLVPAENIGKVNSSGFEGTLGYNHPGNFTWGLAGNFTFAKSKIIYIDEAAGTIPYQAQTGHPLNTYLLYKSIGIFRSQSQLDNTPHVPGAQVGDLIYADVNNDGLITAADQTRSKYGNIPQIVYGFNFNAGYKNFDLSVLFAGQAEVSQYVLPESGTIGNYFSSWANNAWSPTNPNGSYPKVSDRASSAVSGGLYNSTFWLNDASFLRLKNVQLGYNLAAPALRSLHISGLRVFVSAFNLFTITRVKDYDPEGTSGSGQFYPEQRIINIGANVKF
ncbi:SusC/RagA family TonB-linked outer membrane protein [Mucilaginibacter gotjawali]|uniref:Vitamin B12 transporter BtuB n=2 Tax=Mucilaginibacter gotjawali TaxID=1550579 RepID=A0A120MZ83_9SPHI|nr:TonB-dependent receptor [Mucilaginibacter gotjawali]MBB3057653.1 TonB-linked SusC/RagA family outer membrane protein [Mucilaginibacter gotjawali]BAU55316.1 Vitamin B12 transporter BtuB [Mucilaginibacter gotjawali]